MSSKVELGSPESIEITLVFSEHPAEKADNAVALYFSDFPGLDVGQVRDILMDLANEREEYPRYNFRATESHFSWGADASAAEVIIELATDVGSAIAIDLVARCVTDLARRGRTKIEPLDRESAIEYAMARIPLAYHEKRRHLQVVKEVEKNPGRAWTITIKSKSSGDRYKIRVDRVKKRAVVARISRKVQRD